MIKTKFGIGDWVLCANQEYVIKSFDEENETVVLLKTIRKDGLVINRQFHFYDIQPVDIRNIGFPSCPICTHSTLHRNSSFEVREEELNDGVVVEYGCERCGTFRITSRAEMQLANLIPREKEQLTPENIERRQRLSLVMFYQNKEKHNLNKVWTSKDIFTLFEKAK